VVAGLDGQISKDNSLDKIIKCIENNESFVLDAGAGSGKTWSLIETIKYIIENNSENYNRLAKNLGCITYTNVAVEEIKKRIGENEILVVNTIHEFLWDIIKQFQMELKEIIVNLHQEVNDLSEFSIDYRNYRDIKKGIISHDDVIEISSELFAAHRKLQQLFIDKYPVILVDEYQDTHQEVVNIFLDLINNNISENLFTVGFFGDSLQSIYDKRTAKITENDKLSHITKESNFRSAEEIINLLNVIRTDIEQFPAGKNKSIQGSKHFIYNDQDDDKNEIFQGVKNKLESDWGSLKVFFLTYKRIASNSGFRNLFKYYKRFYEYYEFKEKLFEKECPIITFLADRVEKNVSYYENNNIFSFMENIDFNFLTNHDKIKLKRIMDKLIEIRDTGKVKDVWNFAFDKKLFVKGDKIVNFQKDFEQNTEKKQFFKNIMRLDYEEIINFYNYNENDSVFSTQHGTKGEEYENVLLVIMDRNWNKYNFAEYLTGDLSELKDSIYQRTQNLFYVSCSRAVKNLAVLYLTDIKGNGLSRVKDWFGNENVISVNEFLI